MKIIFFDDAHTFGGAQIAAISMAQFIREKLGYEVCFFCSPKNDLLIERLRTVDGIDIKLEGYTMLPLSIVSHIFLVWKLPALVRRIRAMQADACVVNMSGIEFGWLYIYATRLLGLKRVLWLHNTFTYADLLKRRGWRGALDKVRDALGDFAARQIWNDLVTVSHSARLDLLNRVNRHSGIKVMGNTIFEPSDTTGAPADLLTRVIAGYEARKIVIVPGRTSFGHKGQDKIVACLDEMNRQGIAVVFIGDGEDLPMLRQLCQRYANVFFVGWQQSIAAYLVRADVVLLPSRFETQGLIAMESMYLNAPVLVSGIPAFAELMGSEFVVDFDDAREVCRRIEWIAALEKEELKQAYADRLRVCCGETYKEGVAKILAEAKC